MEKTVIGHTTILVENEFSKVSLQINFISTYQQQIFKKAIYKSIKNYQLPRSNFNKR